MSFKLKENTKEMIIINTGTRMVKDGEEKHGIQTTDLRE